MRGRDPDDATDLELVDRVERDGDDGAFRELYRRHNPRLAAVLARVLAADPADQLQEPWVRATTGLASFRRESSFATWLTGIGINVCRDHLRRLDKTVVPIERSGHLHTLHPQPADGLDLERAIARLPEDHRIVVVLHDVEGYRHREIGELLGISEGASRTRLYLARKTLRQWLGGDEEKEHETNRR